MRLTGEQPISTFHTAETIYKGAGLDAEYFKR